jgi:hypothetical protein
MNRRIFTLSKSGLFDYLTLEQIEKLCQDIKAYTLENKRENTRLHTRDNLICKLVLNETMSRVHREPDENPSEFWKNIFMDLCEMHEQTHEQTHTQNTIQETKVAVARYYLSNWGLYGTREDMQDAYQKLEQEAQNNLRLI